jgi:diguanylate cyclase (GGDEF)-like protein/PAS domain S-box-containing protein
MLSAFMLASFIVLTLTTIGLQLSRYVTETVTWTQHSYEVINRLVQAKSDTIEVELNTQSYRIAGDAKYITNRNKAIQAREKSLQLIKLATQDSKLQQSRWNQLREVINQRLAIASHMISLRNTQGLEAANAYIATTPLQETRNRMYQLLDAMETEERQLLSKRLIEQEQARQSARAAVLYIGIFLIGFLVFTYFLIKKQLKEIYLSRKRLAESEIKLSTTLQSIGDGVITTDLGGRITSMNQIAEKLSAWQFTDAQGLHVDKILNIINELTGQPISIFIENTIKTEEIQNLEKRSTLIDRNGNMHPISDSVSPILDLAGMISGFVIVFRDVSFERKKERDIQSLNNQLEREVQNRAFELRTSEQNLRSVTDNIPALIAYVDANQRYVYANQRYLDRFAPENNSIKGLTVSEVLDNDRYAIAGPMIAQALTGKSKSYDWQPFPNVWQMVNYVPTTDIEGKVSGYYVLISDITERKLAELELYKLTHFDDLTGLSNETQFTSSLNEVIESGKRLNNSFALVQINIEKLGEINDALGFSKGDQVLQEFAERLKLATEPLYKLARLRGDEFAILLNNCSTAEAIASVNKLGVLLNQPIVISNITLDISAKIGIAMFPEHGTTPHDLYRHSDSAVREAKKKGEFFHVFDQSLDSDMPYRLALAAELRDAIEHNNLELYLQPKVDFGTGRVCGVEALIRWNHPVRGLISPIQFIPLAEQIGLIKPLTEWVIDTALELLHVWENSGFIMPISVNLSARNLNEDDLVERIHQLKTKWNVGAELFEIEVTESSIMDDAEHALKVLRLLHEQGIALSVDDFGTGYSSLSYLQKLPVQFIKIDQSFIKDMLVSKESLMIVRSTIDLAHDLGKKVVAEGVETKEHWDQLVKLGCDKAQGYFFAKPMPVDVFLNWIKEFKNTAVRSKG